LGPGRDVPKKIEKKRKEQKNKRTKEQKNKRTKEQKNKRTKGKRGPKEQKKRKKGRGRERKKEKKKRGPERKKEKKKGDPKEKRRKVKKKKRNETGTHCWIRSTCCRYVPCADVLRRNAHRAAGNAVHRRGRLRVRRAIPHRVRDLRGKRVVRENVLLERTLGFRMLAF
jgi:hypothetical protein